MTATDPTNRYVLGNSDEEHQRLMWQATRVAPFTERLFREAGIGPGKRVLDIGSGVGDVALLVARLVGPSGEVVGIDRDSRSIARARSRVAEVGLRNVSFVESDVSGLAGGDPFDAVVGRFILMWLRDPVAVLRSACRLVRAGGVVAFQEPCWLPTFALLAPLPLWSAAASAIYETVRRSGANGDLGLTLYRTFEEAGLRGPTMRLDMQLGKDPDIAEFFVGLMRTLRPQAKHYGVAIDGLSDLETLRERLQAEVAASNAVGSWPAFVSAWSRMAAV
jgi:ubiquinone/menaquinone biosynthesis C-methylase UbiE